jgi:DNA-binding response OmpR family regulator
MEKILLVEDDLNLAFIMKENLEDLEFEVLHITEGESILPILKTTPVALILLDVELLGAMNGFDAAELIRKDYPELPIIFTTARNSGKDIERGFSIEHIDYVKKPFGIKEIAIRIQALLGTKKIKDELMVIGSFTFDPNLHQLFKYEQVIHLTNLESRFLTILYQHAGKIVNKEQLIQLLWNEVDDPKGKESSLHNLAYNLRKYLREETGVTLEVVPKKGYRILI